VIFTNNGLKIEIEEKTLFGKVTDGDNLRVL